MSSSLNPQNDSSAVLSQEYFFTGKQRRWDHDAQVKRWGKSGLAPNNIDEGSVVITYATPTARDRELVAQSGVFVNERISRFRTPRNWMKIVPREAMPRAYHTSRNTMSVHHELVEEILKQAAVFEKENNLLRTGSFDAATGEVIPAVAYIFNEQSVGYCSRSTKNLGRVHFHQGRAVNYKGVHWSVVDQRDGPRNGVQVNFAGKILASKSKPVLFTLDPAEDDVMRLQKEFSLQQGDLLNCRPTQVMAPESLFDPHPAPAKEKSRRFYFFS